MKSNRIIALLLAAVLLLSLCACKKEDKTNDTPSPASSAASTASAASTTSTAPSPAPAAPKEDYTGKYISVQGVMGDYTLSGDEISGFDIELKEGGKGTLDVDGDIIQMTWSASGGKFTMKIEGEEMTGTIGDDLIVVEDMLGMGMTLTLAREGSEAANPENWIPEEVKNLIGVWTSYSVVDVLGDDVSDSYDPAGMVLDIRADYTISCTWEGSDLGKEEWDFLGGSCYLDNGVSFSYNDDGDLQVDFCNFDLCDDYLTYICKKGGSASASGGSSGGKAQAASAPAPVTVDIPGGVRYDCIAFSEDSELYSSDGTWLILGDATAALSVGGAAAKEYARQDVGIAIIFQGGDDMPTGQVDGDMIVLTLDGNAYYLLKEGGTPGDNYRFLSLEELKTPSGGGAAAPVSSDADAPASAASGGSAYGKSVAGADGIVPADKLMEAAMIVRGGFDARHCYSYEEIYELMGGVHGEPYTPFWNEEQRSHYYMWHPDNDPDAFFSAQFVAVDGEEMGKTFQYPGDIYNSDGTPYETKPAADAVGKSRADADGLTSKEGLAAFLKQRMEQEAKYQGIEMSYEQIKALCGCDGAPDNTGAWTADLHSYQWKVDDDIYYVADFAVLSTGAEIYISGSGAPDLEEKLGLK